MQTKMTTNDSGSSLELNAFDADKTAADSITIEHNGDHTPPGEHNEHQARDGTGVENVTFHCWLLQTFAEN